MGVGRGTQGVMLEATWSGQLLFCIPESSKLHILISIRLELLKGSLSGALRWVTRAGPAQRLAQDQCAGNTGGLETWGGVCGLG